MLLTLPQVLTPDELGQARAWLAEAGVEHRFHDFKKAGVPEPRLDAWIAAFDLVGRRVSEVGTMTASEVPTQSGMRTSSGTPMTRKTS